MFHDAPPRPPPKPFASCSPSSPLEVGFLSNDSLCPPLVIPSQEHGKRAADSNRRKRTRNDLSAAVVQRTEDDLSAAVVQRTEDGKLKMEQRIHKYTERARRSNMNYMLSTLQSLIPGVGSKADKVTTVDKAIAYIRSLQNELHILAQTKQELQLSLLTEGNSSFDATALLQQPLPGAGASSQASRILIDIFGSHVTITFNCVTGKRVYMSSIFKAVESYQLSIEHAYTRANKDFTVYMIHAEASGDVLISKESLLTTFQAIMLEFSTAD